MSYWAVVIALFAVTLGENLATPAELKYRLHPWFQHLV
jgi:hypothetical protein